MFKFHIQNPQNPEKYMETKTMCCPLLKCEYTRNSTHRHLCKCPKHREILITRYEKQQLTAEKWESIESYHNRIIQYKLSRKNRRFAVFRLKLKSINKK